MIIGISGKIGSGKDLIGKIIQYLVYNNVHNLNLTYDDYCNILIVPDMSISWEIKKFAYKVKQIASILTGIPINGFEKQEIKESYLGEEWDYYRPLILVPEISDKMMVDGESEYATEEDVQSRNALLACIDIEERSVERKRLTVRELLQRIGTDCMRDNLHQNTWVNALMSEYKATGTKIKDSYKGKVLDALETDCEEIYPNWVVTDVRFPNEFQAIKDRGGIVIRVVRPIMPTSNELNFVTTEEGRQAFDKALKEEGAKYGLNSHISETALDAAEFDYNVRNDGTIEDLIVKVNEILIKEKII